ncbi:MAG: DUF288 domain-containing protein [Betaproteobacteria bacterium]|nr:DUF288 domain-containing protein [Betaproteobacteria bacterium]
MRSIVITSIQPPTPSVVAMTAKAAQIGMRVIVVGDRKTPSVTWPNGVDFISLSDQSDLPYSLPTKLPIDHYSRKNIGYLIAVSRGSALIYDTDDDNSPLDSWSARTLAAQAHPVLGSGWINAYRHFSDMHIWPRGLPLDKARHEMRDLEIGALTQIVAPIQQGLANGSPDVDAVWRLLFDQEVTFHDEDSLLLPAGAWCPFNSQSTWWFPEAYPLLYLPSFVSFRMTDIWRSFVAQRCLWALGHGVVFHSAEMYQDRNPHNLLRDFELEVPGYLENDRIRSVLEQAALPPGQGEVTGNLHRCYDALIKAGLIPAEEMKLVEAWIDDINGCQLAAWN